MRHRLILALLLAATSFPALAGGEETLYAAPGARFFSLNEQVGALDTVVSSPRYARPSSFLHNVDIPDLAGSPVPVDPVDLVPSYAPGALVPSYGRYEARDTKGSAHLDVRREVRRTVSSPRMAW